MKRAAERGNGPEHNLRLSLETMTALVYTLSPTGELEFCSHQLLDLFGTSFEDLQDWGKLTHPDDLDRLTAKLRHCIAAGEPFDDVHRLRRADGRYHWIHTQARPLWQEGRIIRWYGRLMNVDELKQVEERARRSEAFFVEAQRLSHCGSWGHDPVTGKVTCSPEMLRVAGVQPHEDPSTVEFWIARVHPDDRQYVLDTFGRAERELTEYLADYRIVLPDGTIRHLHSSGHPLMNARGELTEFVGTTIDMTDQWLARQQLQRAFEALRTTESRLSQAMRIATVGELAASIAHEVNQPLAAVVTNAHACLRWLSAEPPDLAHARQAAERIVRDGKGAGEVVRRVRSLFQRTRVERRPLDLNEVIGEVLRLIERELERRQTRVETDLDAGLPHVIGDRVQLQQVVFNLLKNALEAMAPVVDRPRVLFIRSRRNQDAYALVEVRDVGVGMQEPESAFEAFFTTKEGGMGVGLAICRSIVDGHDGKIWIAPGDPVGTTLCFTVPLAAGATP